jgi:hypothetical protein
MPIRISPFSKRPSASRRRSPQDRHLTSARWSGHCAGEHGRETLGTFPLWGKGYVGHESVVSPSEADGNALGTPRGGFRPARHPTLWSRAQHYPSWGGSTGISST